MTLWSCLRFLLSRRAFSFFRLDDGKLHGPCPAVQKVSTLTDADTGLRDSQREAEAETVEEQWYQADADDGYCLHLLPDNG